MKKINNLCVHAYWVVYSTLGLQINILQLRAKQTAPLVERKDVSFILTIFPQNFWNK